MLQPMPYPRPLPALAVPQLSEIPPPRTQVPLGKLASALPCPTPQWAPLSYQ